MVRYYMSFAVPHERQRTALQIIRNYFDELVKNGPGGMRSQCYADHSNDGTFIHIKSFRKESVANQHFRSPLFRTYIEKLTGICGQKPEFSRLMQQESFESIY